MTKHFCISLYLAGACLFADVQAPQYDKEMPPLPASTPEKNRDGLSTNLVAYAGATFSYPEATQKPVLRNGGPEACIARIGSSLRNLNKSSFMLARDMVTTETNRITAPEPAIKKHRLADENATADIYELNNFVVTGL